MDYEWDKNKAASNRRKHGIDFADAVSVFADDAAITIVDDHPDEERFVIIGMDVFGRILVVVYTSKGRTYPIDLRPQSNPSRTPTIRAVLVIAYERRIRFQYGKAWCR